MKFIYTLLAALFFSATNAQPLKKSNPKATPLDLICTFTSNMKGDNREISDEAKNRVRTACGCDQYAKNSGSVSSNAT